MTPKQKAAIARMVRENFRHRHRSPPLSPEEQKRELIEWRASLGKLIEKIKTSDCWHPYYSPLNIVRYTAWIEALDAWQAAGCPMPRAAKLNAGGQVRFPFWQGRTVLYSTWMSDYDCETGVSEHPILAVTPKFVVIDRERREAPLPADQVPAADTLRLSREKLEREGRIWSRRAFDSFEVERPEVRSFNTAALDEAIQDEIAEVRGIMQRTHPDKGGDPEKFIAARKRFRELRRRMRRAAA